MAFPDLLHHLRGLWPELCAALVIGAVGAHWGGLLLARRGLVAQLARRQAPALLLLGTVLAALPLLPISGHRFSLASLWISVFSEFSTMTVLLVFTRFAAKPGQWRIPRLAWPLVLAALAVYAGVLFEAGPDLYRWGYARSGLSPLACGALLLLLALWAWRLPPALAWLPAAAVLSWALGLQTSSNLWDYLIDLPLFIVLLAIGLRPLLRPSSAP